MDEAQILRNRSKIGKHWERELTEGPFLVDLVASQYRVLLLCKYNLCICDAGAIERPEQERGKSK